MILLSKVLALSVKYRSVEGIGFIEESTVNARLMILGGLLMTALTACGSPEEATPELTETAEVTEMQGKTPHRAVMIHSYGWKKSKAPKPLLGLLSKTRSPCRGSRVMPDSNQCVPR